MTSEDEQDGDDAPDGNDGDDATVFLEADLMQPSVTVRDDTSSLDEVRETASKVIDDVVEAHKELEGVHEDSRGVQ